MHLKFIINRKIITVKEVWIRDLNKHRFFSILFFRLLLSFSSIETEIHQTFEAAVFRRLSKHLKFRQKYSAARRIFNSLLGVWISR